MEPIARCESCDIPLHEGEDHRFDPDGIVWVCRACVEAEEDRLRQEFGWIGVWRGDSAGKSYQDDTTTCEPMP
jgi:hypothetical protein